MAGTQTTVSRRGTKLLLAGNAGAQLCALARYTLLARLLGPEQLGLAVTLILTSQFFESISDSGSDRFLVQDADGDSPRVQRLVHLLAVLRGGAIALALIVFSGPIARFYQQPVLAAGLIALAAAPFIMGFMHFDLRRLQRHHDFAREGTVMLVAESVSLIVTVSAALITRDFTAVLYGLIARAAVMVLVSRLMAERRYAIGYSREHAPRLAAFAAPLMANGFVLFVAGQGDRLLIGNQVGVAALGHYSAILLLIFYPSAAIMKMFHSMQLPILSAARGDPQRLGASADAMASSALLLSLAMAAGFAVIAPLAVPLLYGRAFAQPATIIALIGVLQTCRFIRIWPTTAAVAAGRSGIVLANNIVRIIAFPAAIAGLWLIGGVFGLTLGFVLGELVAFVGAVVMANRALRLEGGRDGMRVVAFITASTAIVATAYAAEHLPAAVAMLAALVTAALLGVILWLERVTVMHALDMAQRLGGLRLGRHARAKVAGDE